jgi:hypothetical protein
MGWSFLDSSGRLKELLDTYGVGPTQTVLTSGSGTYTPPSGCTAIKIECIGGGGGSAGCAASASTATLTLGMSGGGGAYSSHFITNPAASYAYSVGAGGTAGAANGSGGIGGDTTFGGTLCVAKGGAAGVTGGNLGSGSTLGFTTQGGGGQAGGGAGNGILLSGGLSMGVRLDGSHAQADGGTAANGGCGGNTQDNGTTASGAAGSAGQQYGGGAAGAWDTNLTARAGAAGAGGVIIVTEYYGLATAASTYPQQVTAPAFVATGLTGVTAASRYAGATSSGAPASGNFGVGDFTVDQSGNVWVCTVAGSPGTWKPAGSQALIWDSVDAGVSLPAATIATPTLPTQFKHLIVVWRARSNTAALAANIYCRINGDTTAGNYNSEFMRMSGSTASNGEQLGTIAGLYMGDVPGANAESSSVGSGVATFDGYGGAQRKPMNCYFQTAQQASSGTSGFLEIGLTGARWASGSAVTSLTFLLSAGSFNSTTDTQFSVYGVT